VHTWRRPAEDLALKSDTAAAAQGRNQDASGHQSFPHCMQQYPHGVLSACHQLCTLMFPIGISQARGLQGSPAQGLLPLWG
jgi:hypothetical protein